MQLLIVHHDVEVGEELVRMVKEYTEHQCGFANSDARAVDWARGVPRCSLLLTQLHGEDVNGLALAARLSDTFAGLQTMFLPEYPASEQRLDIPQSKVFPEPIEGERLLNAIARAEEQRQTGMDLFHALDVLQMCCLSLRSGAIQLVKGSKTAIVYLLSGRIIHAERGAARGADALYDVVAWEAVEFAYDYSVRAPVQTITTSWDEAVIAAVSRRKAQVVGAASTAAAAAPPPAETKATKRGLFGGMRKLG
jgi:CheY-like chemotaxis protein